MSSLVFNCSMIHENRFSHTHTQRPPFSPKHNTQYIWNSKSSGLERRCTYTQTHTTRAWNVYCLFSFKQQQQPSTSNFSYLGVDQTAELQGVLAGEVVGLLQKEKKEVVCVLRMQRGGSQLSSMTHTHTWSWKTLLFSLLLHTVSIFPTSLSLSFYDYC